jgi:hypothetical protein
MRAAYYVLVVAGLVAWTSCIYFWFIRPWRRERRLGTNALLALAFQSMWWQDTFANLLQPVVVFNSAFFNLGGWNPHIPGWLSQHGNLTAAPLLWDPFIYIYAFLGPALVGAALLRKAKARWPALGKFGLVAVAYGFFVICDLIMEPLLWLPWGMYTYASVIPSLTLFYGHYYQFPVYEAILWPACWTIFAAVLFFKDDNGQTVVERGIERLRVTPRQKTWVRGLAYCGGVNLVVFVYSCVHIVLSAYTGPWPEDIQNRSYFSYQCGPRTTYACPSPRVPIRRPDSMNVDPAGNLVPPKG